MNNLIILGNFDGVHLGHKNLIKKAVEYARKNNMKSIVYTFDSLPKNKKLITTLSMREKIIKDLGVDEIIFEKFENVKKYDVNDFIEKILKEKLKASIVFCGYNYRFAYMRKGDANILSERINTVIVDEFRLDGNLVSSSKIRELLSEGKIKEANRLIGRPLEFDGKVIKGHQLGRLIGFKTANICLDDTQIRIPNGVYGSITRIDGYDKEFLSITNVGKKPTVSNNEDVNIETHILDFDEDIYGKTIYVSLITMLRFEVKFNSIDELKNQITKDCENWKGLYVRYKDK